MEGWFKIASVAFTATAAVAAVIAGIYYESQRRQNERQSEYAYGNPTRERINNDEFRTTNNQRQSSQDSTIETNKSWRKAELERAAKLAKLREERRKQLKEEEKKRKEEEDEKKRKREEEEKERKKNEEMKSMLDSFDDAFDIEIGVKTEKEHIDENIDDWSRNAEKQKLKQEFRAKQMAQRQKSQDEKEKINSNNRTDDLKIEQQKSTITKCVIDQKFKLQELLLNTIISINIENNFTLAISLKSIKKNKKKKVIDLQELESAVFSLQEISQDNESPKNGALPKNSKKKVKRKKAEKQTDAQKKQENKLQMGKNFESCRSIFVQKQLEDQKRKLELEKKKREEVIAEWKLRRQLRQQYHKLASTKSFENHSNITPLQKQLENQKRKVKLEVNRRGGAKRINCKPNVYDDEIIYGDSYNYRRLDKPNILNIQNQLSELMLQTKQNFTQYQETEDEKEKTNEYGEKDKLKVVKQKSTILKPACNKKFKCPKFVLYAIININTTNNDTVAASLRGIEKNKKKKVIDLQELESAVCDLQEIVQENDSLQDHELPETVKGKVKKPKSKEQLAAQKRKKELRKQERHKVIMQRFWNYRNQNGNVWLLNDKTQESFY